MSQLLQNVFDRIVSVISRNLMPMFKDGTRVTVIARTPGNNEADILVTPDEVDELIALLERSRSRGIVAEEVA